MGDKQRKLKDKASRAYSDGDLKDALKLYQRVVAEDPTELQCQLKMGDIHRRLGNFEAAVAEYAPVARAYAEDGLLLKAIAVCKMILGIDPDHAGATKLLADLYDKRRGPPATATQPAAGPPVTLQGMGIAPPPSQPAQQFGNYGMIEFGGDAPGAGLEAPSIPNDTGGEAWAASEASPDTPAVVGEPESPPPATSTPAPPSSAWPVSQSTPGGAPPTTGWPATGAPATPAWPGAAPSASTPDTPAAEAKVVVGQPIEDSALDITVGEPVEEIEPIPLEDSALDITVEEPKKPRLETVEVVDADGDTEAQLSSLLSELSEDEPVAPPSEPSAEETWDGRVKIEDVDAPAVVAETAPATDVDGEPVIELTSPIAAAGDADFGRPQIPLFSDLPKNAFIELLVQMDMREVAPGEYVVREGDSGDSFFVLATGQVRVTRKDDEGKEIDLAILTDGAFFGEMAVLQDSPRTASVIAEQDSQVFELKKDVLDSVVEQFPSVAKVLRNFYKQRLLSTAMATHPLFRPFSPDERRSLMELFKSKNFSEGDVLLAEGKKGTGLFILLYGSMEVSKDNNGDKLVLATLGPGDMFGEMSLLTGAPTSATVKAMSDCFVLRLSKRKFDEVIMTHPQILELVAMVSDERASINDALMGEDSFSAGAVLV